MKSELKVDLKTLPHKGLDFFYDQNSGELTKKLKPLIGENDYRIKVYIFAEGRSSYCITGKIQTSINLLCSRCAYEFKEPVNKKFREKIILQKKRMRIDKEVRNNHFSELMSKEDFTLIDNTVFDIGDFLYELIAIEEPIRPLGYKDCDNDSFHCKNLESMKLKIKQKGNGQIFFA